MNSLDNFFDDDWIKGLKKLTKARQIYIDEITSPLIVKVNIYIDGNNLFLNLEKDLEHILEIYKLAQDNYSFYLSTLDDFESMHKMDLDFNTVGGLEKSPEKLANLAAWYLNSMQSKIRESIRVDNAKSLLGELDLSKNEIVFESEVFHKEKFIDGLTYYELLAFLSDKKFHSKINDETIMKVLTKIINSIDGFKNIKIPLKVKIFKEFLSKNPNMKDKLSERLKTYNLEKLKDKVFIKLKFNYSIYRAKIDVKQYIQFFQKKLRIEKLSNTQKNFYSENIKLLKNYKIKLNINSPRISDIKYRDNYYEKLETMTKGKTMYGFFKYNSFSFGEKAVDSKLILDCQESMSKGNADIHCVLSNDNDFFPLFEKAKEMKKELYLCSVVPRKTIAKNLKDIVDAKHIFHIKYVDLEAMFHEVLGTNGMTGYELVSFIKNKNKRKELINETTKKIYELYNSLEAIKNSHKQMDKEIDKFFKERIE